MLPQMPMPTFITPLARVANLLETGQAVRTAVAGWGFDLDAARHADGVDNAIQDGIVEMLHDRGVALAAPGKPVQFQQLGSEGVRAAYSGLLRPASPARHSLSELLRASADFMYGRLLGDGSQRDCTRLRSARGPTAGKSLVAPAGLQPAQYTDEDIVEVLRWRLGIAEVGDGLRCRNFAAKTMTECGHDRDCWGDHSVCCSYGPLRIKRHDNIADALGDMIEETGAHVRREAFVAAFSTLRQEAWLDIWAFAGLQIQDLLVDVTVRHPMVAAYQPAASSQDGVAAIVAEGKKQVRYPPRAGRAVTPFAVETWGRLGPHAEQLLQLLAGEATRYARRRGHSATAGAFLRKWRATLNALLQKSVAKSLRAARVGLPGRPHKAGER